MGFFSNLKNAVTGGAASVSVQAPATARGQILPVKIEAVAKSSSTANSVYLLVRASEVATVKDTDFHGTKATTETVHGRKTTYETRIQIAGATKLEQGQTYRWEGQVPIPPQLNPTFTGQMIQHVWEIQAGLDMTGNDPDSGWIPIQVS